MQDFDCSNVTVFRPIIQFHPHEKRRTLFLVKSFSVEPRIASNFLTDHNLAARVAETALANRNGGHTGVISNIYR